MDDRDHDGERRTPLDLDGFTIEAEVSNARVQAEVLWVDGLLERALGVIEDDRRAVEVALQRLRFGDGATGTKAPGQRRWGLVASAAGLLVAVGLGLLILVGPGASSAQAALTRALERAERSEARAFAAVLRRAGSGEVVRRAELFTGGADAFAIKVAAPFGGYLWAGADQDGAWFVPALEALPMIETDQRSRLLERLEEHGASLPYVDVLTLLRACSEDFELSLDRSERCLSGVRRSSAPPGPDRFELQLDSQGELFTARLERDVDSSAGAWVFELERLDVAFDPALVERASHHAPGRRVLRR
ncbi:hypothetical protein [Engelhardtia mirabilis]|uniref:Uncharacterized protein n=1 Tax=Engelhardtia mirabilis TaxID=2528011 RepID=A0A518BGJ3_9BACT|nr:hypothetical protein Pla133_11680 [Planctomycetes bacterium Pla133]QDV00429.1 hypothetical protein Pla86_11680 [Planctomycetes bacterium Pla86]